MIVRIDVSVTIARLPQDVFAVITDVAHHTNWVKGPDRIWDVSENPAVLGTTWRQASMLLGRQIFETHAKVNVWEADHRFGFEFDKPIPGSMLWQLEPGDNGTRVSVTIEGEAKGFLALAMPFMRKGRADAVTADLQRLKTQLEATA